LQQFVIELSMLSPASNVSSLTGSYAISLNGSIGHPNDMTSCHQVQTLCECRANCRALTDLAGALRVAHGRWPLANLPAAAVHELVIERVLPASELRLSNAALFRYFPGCCCFARTAAKARKLRSNMKNLRRALGMAFRYKWSIITSTLCAFLIAILWGANIGGVLPIIEIVFKGNSLHTMVDERIERSEKAIQDARDTIKEARRQLATANAGTRSGLERDISLKQAVIRDEQTSIERTRRFEPWIRKYTPESPFATLILVFGVLFLGTVLRCLFLAINMYLVNRVGQRTVLDIQDHVFRNTMQMEVHEMDQVKGTGDLISRIRGETSSISRAITTLLGKTLREPLKMGACIGGAALVNWRLLLLSLVVVPVAGCVMLTIAKLTKRAHRKAVEESAVLLNRLFQAVSYLRLVKAFNMQAHEHHRFSETAVDVYRKQMRISLFNALGRTNSEILGVAIVSLSAIAGAYLVLNGETHLFGIRLASRQMSPSEIMVFFAFLIGISDPLRKMGDVYNMIQSGAVAADRVFALYDQVPEIRDPVRPARIDPRKTDICFHDVRFAYQPGTDVLKDVTVEVPAGTSLAIVGANGCGKSTLINLLLRFFDPDSGCVQIAGHDIRDYGLEDLRRSIGYVTQRTMLFNDTIANNIRYGMPDATLQQVMVAARQAHAHDFITELPDGYETSVGEHGDNLSGGQRQRLALARAILKDAPILVLDEATSQIDPESERLIHRSLARFITHRTTVMITHRLSTLDLADRILVMHDGHVVDCGSHAELMLRCRSYQRLRASQLEEAA
jgi:ATP-binding cassette subfamily B protein/subfamily B ATP-binding cassette protein MsbA